MNEPASEPASPHQCLSELIDGEADRQSAQRACELFAADADGCRRWHEFHLIGDVLRSEDLASAPAHDAAFLSGFRARLEREPVVLALQPAAPRARPWSWATPVAIAAGVVVVAGVLVVLRAAAPIGAGTAPVLAAVPTGAGSPLAHRVSDGQMLRDARVDEYLRAHRATLAGSPAALPGGAMRNVELILPPR